MLNYITSKSGNTIVSTNIYQIMIDISGANSFSTHTCGKVEHDLLDLSGNDNEHDLLDLSGNDNEHDLLDLSSNENKGDLLNLTGDDRKHDLLDPSGKGSKQ
jgi:hypothetical protein